MIEVTERIERYGRNTYFDVQDETGFHLLRVWASQCENEEPTIHIAHSFSDPLSVAREYVEALQKAIEVAEKWKNDQEDDD